MSLIGCGISPYPQIITPEMRERADNFDIPAAIAKANQEIKDNRAR